MSAVAGAMCCGRQVNEAGPGDCALSRLEQPSKFDAGGAFWRLAIMPPFWYSAPRYPAAFGGHPVP
jgi:hypothetical protein